MGNRKSLIQRQCSVEGCQRIHYGLGYCKLHYRRIRETGTVGEIGNSRCKFSLENPDKIMEFISENCKISVCGCWEWQGRKNPDGYGYMTVDKSSKGVHRVVGMMKKDFKKGLSVLHHCDNRACANPEHLFVGTQKDNVKDMIRKERNTRGEAMRYSKLTDNDVRKIKDLLKDCVKQPIIAGIFKVDRSIISRINTGESWKHIQ